MHRGNGQGNGHGHQSDRQVREALLRSLIDRSCADLVASVDAYGWTGEAIRRAQTLADSLLEAFGHGEYRIHRWERWTEHACAVHIPWMPHPVR